MREGYEEEELRDRRKWTLKSKKKWERKEKVLYEMSKING